MSVTLAKGGNVSLSKAVPNLTRVQVGLGWKARSTTGAAFDLDASALLCAGGRVLGDDYFVFYNNLKSPEDSVEHTGDELVGGTGGDDDETVLVDLELVPAHVDQIVFPVSIYDADTRKQAFGQVTDAYIRVLNQDDGQEVARYDLTEDASSETAMIFGELYRHGGEWKFRAVGQGYASGLRGIALDFGVNVS